MKYLKNKKRLFLIPFILILLSGCVTEKDLKVPLSRYLSEHYQIKQKEFRFLTWDNNWLEGIDHQTAIEIKEPYHTTAFITILRDSYKIDNANSDDVYMELFKGAYIKQHPEVISALNQVIAKNSLMKKSPTEYDVAKGNFYYFLNIRIDEQQEEKLMDEFKQTPLIDTITLLPTLKNSEKKEEKRFRGVVNFNFYYNTYKHSKRIPRAESILNDFKKNRVLQEGLYCITVNTMNSSPKSIEYGLDPRNSNVRFRVDSKGKIQDVDVLSPEE
ncbi:hypothetical protein [Bacillus sp. FJAT-49736]|uniref:hypothetical protein n=1 Tax=Bacillus sp. FJAT-49736 TaxID=2833582 RepID=UPI001BC97F39|nr:hypothetical protein [Bacillus sp. FJAT-49736]MBS4174301.1 hypothetical protein [Bacillus sp. FJAT-49736]